jgi:hypothetical protein
MDEMKENLRGVQNRIPWRILAVVAGGAFVGALITSYAYHRANIWIADGLWCTQFTPSGGVERLYGSMCD